MGFKFDVGDKVPVPGLERVNGIVVGIFIGWGRVPEYKIKYVSGGEFREVYFTEREFE